MPANLPWWGWLLIAAGCWFLQLIMSIRTDGGSKGAWAIRFVFIAGMVLCALIGAIRFAKWVWQG